MQRQSAESSRPTISIWFMNKEKLFNVLSVVIALALWQIISMAVGMNFLLPSPVEVLGRLTAVVTGDGFFGSVLFSLLRILAGFGIALILGTVCGALAGKYRIAEIFFKPYVTTVKTVPIASVIIIALVLFSPAIQTTLISFLIAFPVIYGNVLQGIRNVDPKMKELCSLYKVRPSKQILNVYIPSVKPFLLSAVASAVGMAWKAGTAAEVIGLTDGSIGMRLYEAKIYFQNADLFCWTLVIIFFSVVSEKLIMLALKGIFGGIEKL